MLFPQGIQFSDPFHSCQTVSCAAAGEDGVDPQKRSIPVGSAKIPGDIDTPVERQSCAVRGFQQGLHGIGIQISVGIQTTDDEAVSAFCAQHGNLRCHLADFF